MIKPWIKQKIKAIEKKGIALIAVNVRRFGEEIFFDNVPVKILRAIQFEGYYFIIHESPDKRSYNLTHFETGLLIYGGWRKYASISSFQSQAVRALRKRFNEMGNKFIHFMNKAIKRKVLNEI